MDGEEEDYEEPRDEDEGMSIPEPEQSSELGTEDIRHQLERLKKESLTFDNHGAQFKEVKELRIALVHNLTRACRLLNTLESEEQGIVKSMKKAGVFDDERSSDAYKPLAEVRLRIKDCLLEIKEVQIILDISSSNLATKQQILLSTMSGMSLQNEIVERQMKRDERSGERHEKLMHESMGKTIEAFERNARLQIETIAKSYGLVVESVDGLTKGVGALTKKQDAFFANKPSQKTSNENQASNEDQVLINEHKCFSQKVISTSFDGATNKKELTEKYDYAIKEYEEFPTMCRKITQDYKKRLSNM